MAVCTVRFIVRIPGIAPQKRLPSAGGLNFPLGLGAGGVGGVGAGGAGGCGAEPAQSFPASFSFISTVPYFESFAEMVAACFKSEDYKEGRRAFMEKRKPRFQGR